MKPNKPTNTIGADPEVFFKKGNEYIPAIGMVGGTKHSPRKLRLGAVQEDNVMAEFNIPPATTAGAFSKSIAVMLDALERIAANNGCTLAIVPYAQFDRKYLEHPQAREMGCEPDYNAWENTENRRPSYELLQNIRTASGHIHIGIPSPDKDPNKRVRLVSVCDLCLGLPSLFVDRDSTRRKFYGQAGAYRPKPYGVEYRVLSNFWIKKEEHRKWAFTSAMYAANNWEQIYSRISPSTRVLIQKAIDTHDLNLAAKILPAFGIAPLEE